MAITRVDSPTGNAGSDENTGFSTFLPITTLRDISVGEKLFIDCGSNNGIGPVVSIDDGGIGNSFVFIIARDTGGSNRHYEMWYCDVTIPIPSGSTITPTWTSPGGAKNAQIIGYTGLALGGAQKTASNDGFGAVMDSGTTAATTTADSLVRAVYVPSFGPNNIASAATGYTVGSVDGILGNNANEAYKVVAATGAQNALATLSVGADSYVGAIATFPQAASIPVNVTPPAISGIAAVGKTLTATPGTWTGADSVTANWRSDGVAIMGATSTTYTLRPAELGTMIDYLETATHAGDPSATQPSNQLGPVGTSIGNIAAILSLQTDLIIEIPVPAGGGGGDWNADWNDDWNEDFA